MSTLYYTFIMFLKTSLGLHSIKQPAIFHMKLSTVYLMLAVTSLIGQYQALATA